jgi:hypothetical protein
MLHQNRRSEVENGGRQAAVFAQGAAAMSSTDDRKAFAFGRGGKTNVETHEGESRGPALGRRDASRKLQRIGSS